MYCHFKVVGYIYKINWIDSKHVYKFKKRGDEWNNKLNRNLLV